MAHGMQSINVWPGKITKIIDPQYFWMHFRTKELLQQFELLQREILQFCTTNWSSVGDGEQLQYGQVVLIDTGVQDGTRYRRGQVTRMPSNNSVDVFYVDYGLAELKSTDSICVNFPAHFKKWPPQAVRCSLAGIVPISKNWTSRATKTFQKITEGKVFQTLVLYGEPGFCEVSLYPSEGDTGRSVSHLLLDEDLAMPAEGKEVPEDFSEIVEFIAKSMSPDMNHSPSPCEETKQMDIQKPLTSPASKPLDRYVPPQRKNNDLSLSTSFVARESSSGMRSGISNSSELSPTTSGMYDSHGYGSPKSPSVSKHSPKGLHINSGLEKKKPVNDFFPFATVSTYPPTPTSPMKSPNKPGVSPSQNQGSEQSYFSRSPSKQNSVVPAVTDQQFASPSNVDKYSGHHVSKPTRHRDHRIAANLNILPSPGHQESIKPPVSVIGTSLRDGQNAAANLEPSYLNNSIQDKYDPYQSAQRSPKTHPESYQSPTPQHYNTSYKPHGEIPRPSGHLPFYPPGHQHGGSISPQANHHSYSSQPNMNLVPPGFYTSAPSHPHQGGPKEHHRSPQSAHLNGDYGYGHSTGRSPKKDQYNPHGNMDTYNQQDVYNQQQYTYENQYSKPGGYPSPQKHTQSREHLEYSEPRRAQVPTDNPRSPSRPQLKVRLPEYMPTKTTSHEKRGRSRMSPVSPDSAGIGEFNIGDIDHTRHTSADYFGQRVHEEKMKALQEEAEDIAAESHEQYKLVEMSRYGGVAVDDNILEAEEEPADIFQQIAEEITSASTKESEEMKRSPLKRNKSSDDGPYIPSKLESIPAQYFTDIDFAQVVKEALEFTKEDGMENVKSLLDSIVESMKTAKVEKQLYDVLLLMLTKAIQDYSQFHRLILDYVNLLNVDFEIKECLGKVLKKQQEVCIRLPVGNDPKHLNCARLMGCLYVMSHDWMDSNLSIQDNILTTVEKWIVFNNKGTQTGQTAKENLFLDCFGAFWEVAGAKLTEQNYTFKTRIQNEIKKKILCENASRPVRERLLNIVLELFTHCVEHASVHTQTSTRTMIPSSCQVKPSLNSQGTMTKPVEFADGEDLMLDEYTQRWQFLSSNTSTDDPSGNQNLDVSQGASKTDIVEKSESPAEISFQSTNADTSIYMTPNESMNTENESLLHLSLDKDALSSNETASALAKEIARVKMPVQSPVTTRRDNGTEKTFSNTVRNSGSSRTSAKQQPVSASKSAIGKSIVDWFDYEPDSEYTGNTKASVKDKSDTKHLQEKTSIDKAESKVSDSLQKKSNEEKVYPEEGEKTAKNVKSRKNKRHKKASPNKESVTSTPEKETDSQTDTKSLDSYLDPVSLTNNVDSRGADDVMCNVENDIDWWCMEETVHIMDNIYIDTGPDVIIEEDEEIITDPDTLVIDTGAAGDNLLPLSEGIPQSVHYSPVVNESGENNAGTQVDCTGNTNKYMTGISVEELMDEEIQKLNDAYAFDTDTEDEFDDDNMGAVRFDQEFPESNLKEKITMPTSGPSVHVNENSYDQDFPRSNLRDYLPPILVSEQPSQTGRWVPRKRVCLNCHDDGHITENCPKGFLLLQ